MKNLITKTENKSNGNNFLSFLQRLFPQKKNNFSAKKLFCVIVFLLWWWHFAIWKQDLKTCYKTTEWVILLVRWENDLENMSLELGYWGFLAYFWSFKICFFKSALIFALDSERWKMRVQR